MQQFLFLLLNDALDVFVEGIEQGCEVVLTWRPAGHPRASGVYVVSVGFAPDEKAG